MSFRAVEKEDAELLFNLFSAVAGADYAFFPEDQKRLMLGQQFELMTLSYSVDFPCGQHRIICLDGLKVGQVFTNESADEIRLVDISIKPEQRNSGLGSSLINQMINRSIESKTPIRCQVRAMNVGAIRFYLRNGFVIKHHDGPYLQLECKPDN